jgi:hypothetical protein
MQPKRAGVFRSGATKQNYDLNFNFAEHWIIFGGLSVAWQEFLTTMNEIRARAINLSPQCLQLDGFADEMRALGKCIFEIEVKDKIRSMFKAANVYRFERTDLPSQGEVKSVLGFLMDLAKLFLGQAKELFNNLNRSLLSFHASQNSLIDDILYRKSPDLEAATNIPPVEFLSHMGQDIMEHPVITQCCGRSIDKSEHQPNGSCGLCGSKQNSVYDDAVLLRTITCWTQENHFRPPPPSWWLDLHDNTTASKEKGVPLSIQIPPKYPIQRSISNEVSADPILTMRQSESAKRPAQASPTPQTPGNNKRQHVNTPYITMTQIARRDGDKAKLGSGGFGTVYKGEYQFHEVAIKYPHYEGNLPQDIYDDLLAEVRMMQDFNHPNVVRFYGILVEDERNPEPKALVMELGSNGSLYQYLRNSKGKVDWSLRLRIAKDLAAGLAYLHEVKRVIHQDIKSLNVVLDKHFVAKWCDFGLAQLRLHTATHSTSLQQQSAGGTLRWLAPERLKPGGKASYAADIWALGMVFMEIVTGKVPFADTMDDNLVRHWISKGETEDVPQECHDRCPELAAIINLCLQAQSSKRPNAQSVLEKMSKLLH